MTTTKPERPAILDYEYVLANVAKLAVWNFYPTLEAAAADAPRAHAERFCDAVYTAMTWADYKAAERAHYLEPEPEEITEDRFMEMLEVLPPMAWHQGYDFESFLMSEFQTGTYTRQFARRGHGDGAKYYTRIVDASKRDTWMKA